GSEAGNSQLRYQGAQPGDPVVGRSRWTASQGLCDEIVSAKGFGARLALADRPQIDCGNMGQQGGADRSMRCGEHPADRAGETVDGTEPGIGQGKATVETDQRHSLSRCDVLALPKRHGQRLRGTPDAVRAYGIGDRVRPGAD